MNRLWKPTPGGGLTIPVVMAVLLSGCLSPGERILARAKREDTCKARLVRPFVGLKADAATRAAVERRAGREARWIAPSEDIIADLQPGRLNINLGGERTILSAACF